MVLSCTCIKWGLVPKDSLANMVATLRDNALALSTVRNRAAEFRRKREKLEDDPTNGCPATITSKENIDRPHLMMMDDRRLTINQLTNDISIFCERIENIVRNELDMTKDNASAQKRLAPMAAVHDCDFELVDHHNYPPDLALSHYHLFSNIKRHLNGNHALRTLPLPGRKQTNTGIAVKSVVYTSRKPGNRLYVSQE
ncbi:uncharacterized protein LOC106876209 [Octopus bimaculoides]|uniref:uncharacterized protein LOC106876209 n=1 Tax=Octopus bimaculoides TaxID=37653 RepID=UPI00071CC263|nr:uncharacterized protein LOC106876209 [Octopus bimaculoides]|eukprot:XP_014780154.1 PREDICTED: uncharacterized protein LOC106876209 [Octopus bimaculoides]